jgi:hypothetical protein
MELTCGFSKFNAKFVKKLYVKDMKENDIITF